MIIRISSILAANALLASLSYRSLHDIVTIVILGSASHARILQFACVMQDIVCSQMACSLPGSCPLFALDVLFIYHLLGFGRFLLLLLTVPILSYKHFDAVLANCNVLSSYWQNIL